MTMTMAYERTLTARQRFVRDIRRLAGSDVRMLWVPQVTDNGKTVTYDELGQTITWANASVVTALGKGAAQTFNGTSDRGVLADLDKYSFGIGTADQPGGFSCVALANVTDTAAARVMLNKFDAATAAAEWGFQIGSTDVLQYQMFDQSAGVSSLITSALAITMGSPRMLAATYSAATGGATAAGDMLAYQDGVAVADSEANNAAYVAMENLATALTIGARGGTGALWYAGTIAFLLLAKGVIGPTAMREINALLRGFYGVPA